LLLKQFENGRFASKTAAPGGAAAKHLTATAPERARTHVRLGVAIACFICGRFVPETVSLTKRPFSF
jgi:hypothetical protein